PPHRSARGRSFAGRYPARDRDHPLGQALPSLRRKAGSRLSTRGSAIRRVMAAETARTTPTPGRVSETPAASTSSGIPAATETTVWKTVRAVRREESDMRVTSYWLYLSAQLGQRCSLLSAPLLA